MGERLLKIISAVFFVGTGVGIVYPAFLEPSVGLTQIFVSLFNPQLTSVFALRWLIVLSFLLSGYVLFVSWYYRNMPLTVIRAEYEIKFLNDDLSVAEFDRKFVIRANQPNVTAYFTTLGPDYGVVPRASISASVYCESCELSSELEFTGRKSYTEGRAEYKGTVEIAQTFGRSLPYKLYMPLIPGWAINRDYGNLPRWLRQTLVKRHLTNKFLEEFNVDEPVLRFSADKYPHLDVTISLKFPYGYTPCAMKARRVRHNGATDIPIQTANSIVSIRIHKLKNETVRITWAPPSNVQELPLPAPPQPT